jgi:hypothetical protein
MAVWTCMDAQCGCHRQAGSPKLAPSLARGVAKITNLSTHMVRTLTVSPGTNRGACARSDIILSSSVCASGGKFLFLSFVSCLFACFAGMNSITRAGSDSFSRRRSTTRVAVATGAAVVGVGIAVGVAIGTAVVGAASKRWNLFAVDGWHRPRPSPSSLPDCCCHSRA